jgi:3-oxoacyl-[acyl-carrier protein] reductase
LRATVERLSAVSSRVEFVAADLSDGSALDEVVRRQRAMSEHVELLVLAAGVGIAGAFADYSLRRLDLQLALNVRARLAWSSCCFRRCVSAASVHPDQGSKVVAIASMIGLCGDPALAAYGASKAALISLCASITASEAEHGVTATAIAPGYVDTDMSAWMRDRLDTTAMIRADDIAELVLSLSRLSRHVAVPFIPVTRPGPNLWRA